jgi:hypothetical protein
MLHQSDAVRQHQQEQNAHQQLLLVQRGIIAQLSTSAVDDLQV